MELIRTVLERQPLLALFLTIAIGYVVGEISVKGFSLGVGAVLFVALAVGWFAPASAPAAVLGNFGLALFLYTVGVQYGRQFVLGLTSAHGLKANLVALTGDIDKRHGSARPRKCLCSGKAHARSSAGDQRDFVFK